MATQLQSLSKLFTEKLFRIPDYQRGYAWGERQVADFWNDLCDLDPEKKHYAGVITFEEVQPDIWKTWSNDLWLIKSKGFTPYYVVDGQQRLTTAIILVQCFIESIGPISEKLNYSTAREITRRYILDTPDGGIVKSYIFGYEEQNPSYDFIRQYIFREKISNKISETAYTANLQVAKEYFTRRVFTLTMSAKELLFKKLTQSFLFNIYEIEAEIDTYVAFETMNNRGKPLSHLELLKNRLIYLSTRLNTYSRSDTSSLRSQINFCWKSIYHVLGKNKEKLLDDDRFLFTHSLLYFIDQFVKENDDSAEYASMMRYARRDYQAKLLDEIFTQKNLCQKNDPAELRSKVSYPVDVPTIHAYVQNLKNSVEVWFDIFNPALSEFSEAEKLWLDRLNRINGMTAAPLLLAFFERESNPEARISLMKAIERMIFFAMVCGPFYGNGDYFIYLAIEFKRARITAERMIKQIDSVVLNMSKSANTISSFKTIAKHKGGFYEWPGIRYFMYEYEQHLRASTKAERNKLAWDDLIDPPTDHITVEHIYPQKPADDSWIAAFGGYTAPQKNLLRNSLGNLLTLSRPKNSSLSNKPFKQKCSEQEKFVGFAYGSLAENEVALTEVWDAFAIVNRSLRLLDFAAQRWNLDLGDHHKRLAMLGLDFVVKPAIKIKLIKSQAEKKTGT